MKALGVTTAKRSAMLPDVPTIAESGVEGYEFGNGHSWFAPRGTPGRALVTTNLRSVSAATPLRGVVFGYFRARKDNVAKRNCGEG